MHNDVYFIVSVIGCHALDSGPRCTAAGAPAVVRKKNYQFLQAGIVAGKSADGLGHSLYKPTAYLLQAAEEGGQQSTQLVVGTGSRILNLLLGTSELDLNDQLLG